MLTVGSLFSGIGGIELGLERVGAYMTLWQVENDPFCSAVLEKRWPGIERFADVRHVGSSNLRPVDLICGGFPCQDLSYAGRGAGIEGTRSGLWAEFARIVRELRPRYVVVENVPALRSRGLGAVLGDLAACGYDAEWDCISAGAVGAHHRRDRIWIVGYPSEQGTPRPVSDPERDQLRDQRQRLEASERGNEGPAVTGDDGGEGLVADASLAIGGRTTRLRWRSPSSSDASGTNDGSGGQGDGQWSSEPNVGRVAHGVPARVDRLTALGNAVVPQVAEFIGRLIVEAEEAAAA